MSTTIEIRVASSFGFSSLSVLCLSQIKSGHICDAVRRGLDGKEYATQRKQSLRKPHWLAGDDLTGLFWTKLCEKLSLERSFGDAEEEVQRGADRGATAPD
jgi:hypothetical protein